MIIPYSYFSLISSFHIFLLHITTGGFRYNIKNLIHLVTFNWIVGAAVHWHLFSKLLNQMARTSSSSAATQSTVLVLSLRARSPSCRTCRDRLNWKKSIIIGITSSNNFFIIGNVRFGKIIGNLVLKKIIPWVHQQFYCCLQNGDKRKRQILISCLDQFLRDFVRLCKRVFFSFAFTLNDFDVNLCLVLRMEVIILLSITQSSVLFTVFELPIYSIWLKIVLSQI